MIIELQAKNQIKIHLTHQKIKYIILFLELSTEKKSRFLAVSSTFTVGTDIWRGRSRWGIFVQVKLHGGIWAFKIRSTATQFCSFLSCAILKGPKRALHLRKKKTLQNNYTNKSYP